jgi:hypothetical protein
MFDATSVPDQGPEPSPWPRGLLAILAIRLIKLEGQETETPGRCAPTPGVSNPCDDFRGAREL